MKGFRLLSSFLTWLLIINALLLRSRNSFFVTSAFVPTSTSPSDEIFHSWCDSMGIGINPSARVITTDKSVAGRGVFAVQDISAGEKICVIPSYMFFHPANARAMFPEKAAALRRKCCDKNHNHVEENTCNSSSDATVVTSSANQNGRKGWLRT